MICHTFGQMHARLKLILFVLIVNLIDLILTIYFDSTIGYVESNPIAVKVIANFGYLGLSIYKSTVVLPSLIVIYINNGKIFRDIVIGLHIGLVVWWTIFLCISQL